jgi:hypothetical protein
LVRDTRAARSPIEKPKLMLKSSKLWADKCTAGCHHECVDYQAV